MMMTLILIYCVAYCDICLRRNSIAEIARVSCHYAVQGHSNSLILVPNESMHATSY